MLLELEETLTLQEAADALGCSYEDALQLLREGRLTGYRLAGHWCVSLSDLERCAADLVSEAV
ncbi:MAG: excisionase family DNA-binding protein [Anaerolineae bacterium]|nr:excisionase family DNA-binding protein [Anaerolineae bacterium]